MAIVCLSHGDRKPISDSIGRIPKQAGPQLIKDKAREAISE
jgi:hypothetical protein